MIVYIEIDQIIVLYLQEHENITYHDIKLRLFSGYGYDYDLIILSRDGYILHDTEPVDIESDVFINASYSNMILGGKGGFGAALRSKAKQKALKATTDFGACRDLNGRRLRHVNDEIILQKFQEAKESGEKLKVDEETPTGIDLWYLSKPGWVDNVKQSSRSKLMKRVGKTELCRDWVSARENGSPPDGAPLSWGCPRGVRCSFAHGVDELRGEGKEVILSTQKNEKRVQEDHKRDEYVRASNLGGDHEELDQAVTNIVRQGLQHQTSSSSSSNSSSSKTMTLGYAEEKQIAPVDDILPFDDYGF
jgi:hypothetical protein